jgi:hypothetical protein
MKKLLLGFFAFATIATVAFAGTEYSGKEMKQTAVVPQECWYGDQEWNVSLWGTYAFTGTDYNRGSLVDTLNGDPGTYDRFLGGDHAWGGGGDVKYFFHRYFGVGVEGFGLAAHGSHYVIQDFGNTAFFKESDQHAVGAALGTFTLRYPIGCSRFAPYAWAGGGGIFGGGERDQVVTGFDVTGAPFATTVHSDSESKAMGQFGGGIEIRVTRHIGWMNDFSWNVVDGPHNNFGMFRSGITFAF